MVARTLGFVVGMTALSALAEPPRFIALRLLPGSMDIIEQCDGPDCNNPSIIATVPIVGRFVGVPVRLGALGTRFQLKHIRFIHTFDVPDIIGEGWHTEITSGPDGPHYLSLTANVGPGELEFDSGQVVNGMNAFPNLDIITRGPIDDGQRRALRVITEEVCPADFDDGTMRGTPDGSVGIDDLLKYLEFFSDGSIAADMGGAIDGGLDDAISIEDLVAFLIAFEQGC